MKMLYMQKMEWWRICIQHNIRAIRKCWL